MPLLLVFGTYLNLKYNQIIGSAEAHDCQLYQSIPLGNIGKLWMEEVVFYLYLTANTTKILLVYDRNRSFGRSFGDFRPNCFGRSFGQGCRTTESAKNGNCGEILTIFFTYFAYLELE